uniref:Variant surface glycoprotein 1125.4703 n=1 Tax=Trypanosoma brucei TaxID=5691 RepID=A0A1J0RAT5_9TRYP|nr:variant surface glycoprotein 1125.4703 [Trypanosoma brucei]
MKAFVQLLKKNKEKTWDTIRDQHQKETKYYSEHWEQWRRVANLPPADPERKALGNWKKHRATPGVKQQIAHLTAEALQIQSTGQSILAKLNAGNIKTAQEKALYGDKGKGGDIKWTTDRQTFCGKGDDDGNMAGEGASGSLYGTLLCLCAGANTEEDAGTGCCRSCTTGGNAGEWNINTDGKRTAEFLSDKCSALLIPTQGSSTELQHRLTTFLAKVGTEKSNTQTLDFAIGAVSGTGASGCTGTVTGNAGRCAKFTEQQIKTADPTLKWRVQLQAAASAWDEQQEAVRDLEAIAKKLKIINTTAAALLYTPIPTEMKNVETPTDTKRRPGSVCFTHKTNATCTANNCKWEGTTETDGKCEVDESKVTAQTNAAGTGEQTSKCTGLDSKEKCEAVQGTPAPGKAKVCGWIEDKLGILPQSYKNNATLQNMLILTNYKIDDEIFQFLTNLNSFVLTLHFTTNKKDIRNNYHAE